MPTSLECRLLCASGTAYSVTTDGPIPEEQPYYNAAQFTDKPVGFASGGNDIDACLVGSTVDGVVLAFRGTLPFDSPDREQTIRDWINDLDVELVKGDNLPGLVHAGFWGALDSLWSSLLPAVQQRLGSTEQLYVTGHSKGGAMANLAAMRLLLEKGINAKVYTYAGPHPGNDDFASSYDQHVESIRYEYADDIVPWLPPSLGFRHALTLVPFLAPYLSGFDFNYAPVGTLRFIDWSGDIVPDSGVLTLERYASLGRLIATGGFEEIVNDHSSECGGGYMSAVCPQGVCPDQP